MELRKDYILDRWVYFAEGRKARPKEYSSQSGASIEKTCLFCPGNEKMTPAEIGRVGNKEKWLIRWFYNKFPAADEKGTSEVKTDNTFFTYTSAFGIHEIISETSRHGEQLWDFGNEHMFQLLKVYISRISELSKLPKISYVAVFKNHGQEAGASLVHSHTQVVAVGHFPEAVEEETSSCARFGSCPYCRIIEIEKNSLRRCFENSNFISFTPYASRFNYEMWIFPKRHLNNFVDLNDSEVRDLAEVLGRALQRLKSINAPYNFVLHYSQTHDLHAHIEITPRLALWAGFEFSTGAIINSVLPEDAAAFYRGEQK